MRIIVKKKPVKSSKGYRLKISTHKLIDKMQEIMQCSQDEVITTACRKLYGEIKVNSEIIKQYSNEN
ncbi:MAG: hypothetical protein ABI543_05410 [Ignavibacteria bacterium]